jgi:hypothetical protein
VIEPTSSSVPAWVRSPQPGPVIPDPYGPPQIMSLGRYLLTRYGSRVAPGLSSTTVLVLARWWHERGAAHSVGDAALMIALSAACAGMGTVAASGRHGEGEGAVVAAAFGAAGAFAVIAPAAYSNEMALPLIVWVVATVLVYAVCAHYWRQDRRADRERRHQLQVEVVRAQREYAVTALQANAAVETARALGTADAERMRQLEQAWIHRRALDAAPGEHSPAGAPAGAEVRELVARKEQ